MIVVGRLGALGVGPDQPVGLMGGRAAGGRKDPAMLSVMPESQRG